MMSLLPIFTIIFALLSSLIIADPCRFQDSTKGVIDLSSLARSDGKPAYPDKTPPTGSNYKFSYNPCKPFSEGVTCIDVAVCQVSQDAQYTFILGKQDSTVWNPGAGLGSTPFVSYTYNEKKVSVSLQCGTDKDNELEALGEDPVNTFKFRLTHKCACWNGCSGPGPQTSTKPSGGGDGTGIGGGAVFIIILLVLVFVYFAGFAAFYRFRMERSGVELIAHRTFWGALPGYAKDGAVHVYRRIASKGGGNTYQSV